MTSESHVAAGAAWLDREAPGWERKINFETLDISDPRHCITGQVFGASFGYLDVCMRLRRTTRASMTTLGFVDAEDKDAWVALVKHRFDTGTLSDMVYETTTQQGETCQI